MRRHGPLVAAALVAAATLAATAGAAVAPVTYKGFLYFPVANGKKVVGSPATVTVAGNTVTIKAANFRTKCRDARGRYTLPGNAIAFEWRGTLKGGVSVDGSYRPRDPNIVGELVAGGMFDPRSRAFTGRLTFTQSGNCQGTWDINAKAA